MFELSTFNITGDMVQVDRLNATLDHDRECVLCRVCLFLLLLLRLNKAEFRVCALEHLQDLIVLSVVELSEASCDFDACLVHQS